MANGANQSPGLSLSRDTFAKLTPGPFLHAHLKQAQPTRPNGRLPHEFRTPTVNTGSLTHSNGSAVVRAGDTAVVCGVRAELLRASDIPHPPSEDIHPDDLVEELGLLVPNVELSTGCSPSHLPGNPPGTLAQSLSYRVWSTLLNSRILDVSTLAIRHTELQPEDEEVPDAEPRVVVKGYWVLYIDILCICLDGNASDTVWLAVMAAFRDTVLPRAWWDADQERILCSSRLAEAKSLKLNCLPVASTFAVFSTASPLKDRAEAESWVLADPDGAEEGVCEEAMTVVIAATGDGATATLLSLEKSGGSVIGEAGVAEPIEYSAP
ncbi:ribosomal protein S5 domain 2-type protein [Neohortaea acidophila]|uniref:Ribosomal RNA-processing protein 43 n=1 Tax=Neohortaea acidophila TaxID=245834 RepID=A0A6A6PIY3_9PEZI|nr:ribosomal protein S5 domain 2-type protein [Neohortaea acidophila]KAF2479674.1 ribosomal protein S5 domain 2-type protein [Neohortaea acidophila]